MTKITVTPLFESSSMRVRHFFWKLTSPTDSTSSIKRISASTLTATLKPRRACMPLEYW